MIAVRSINNSKVEYHDVPYVRDTEGYIGATGIIFNTDSTKMIVYIGNHNYVYKMVNNPTNWCLINDFESCNETIWLLNSVKDDTVIVCQDRINICRFIKLTKDGLLMLKAIRCEGDVIYISSDSKTIYYTHTPYLTENTIMHKITLDDKYSNVSTTTVKYNCSLSTMNGVDIKKNIITVCCDITDNIIFYDPLGNMLFKLNVKNKNIALLCISDDEQYFALCSYPIDDRYSYKMNVEIYRLNTYDKKNYISYIFDTYIYEEDCGFTCRFIKNKLMISSKYTYRLYIISICDSLVELCTHFLMIHNDI